MKEMKISIEEQSKVFKKHLKEPDNERIIFSAAFGAGKTYFLDEFFRSNTEKYLRIKLTPVNYSVASNEDIFKLIKFDILFELLASHGVEQPGKIRIRPDIYYGLKLSGKIDSFFTSITSFFGALNKDNSEAISVISALAVIYSQVAEFTANGTEIPENPEATAFLKTMMESYYKEADDVTRLIESVLDQLTSDDDGKQTLKKVLIIDDLDRLDPEHIFRLFNVFSAHFDYNKSDRNKFGFDKVIFVCDIQNIRNIFHSRYGAETDFSGYIDKFFSQEIFYFNNEQAIKKCVNYLLNQIKIENRNETAEIYLSTNILQGANHTEKWIVYWVLFELIVSGALKPRRIYSPHKAWTFPTDTINIKTKQQYPKEIPIYTVPTIASIQLLSSILGGGEQLLRAVKHAAGQPRSIEYDNITDSSFTKRLVASLMIVDYHNHKFDISEEFGRSKEFFYTHPDGRTIGYRLGLDTGQRELYRTTALENSQDIPFFELLPIMVQKLLADKRIQ
ncbi:P-loop NTPase fold protein [Hymenobacter nivis]|uniref:KAP NTPase domain-containing protein n=1 Tax=Hymenobacter nivis TaxID=1850093 RepID=A0A502GV23_9BACT|nr:P-loop NTPase fold protein [Hymenobacter nivis]TPG66079.1 hypothetical protein EAH73_11965 [Hymenobacter nivis]